MQQTSIRILALLALVVCATCSFAQSLTPQWVSLRLPVTRDSLVVDSISPKGDTLSHVESIPLPGRFVPFSVGANSTSISFAPFRVIYRPAKMSLRTPSSLSGNKSRVNLPTLAVPLTVGDSVARLNPEGLPPVERMRRDYAAHHPEAVQDTWDGILDMSRPERERKVNIEENKSTIAKIFTADADIIDVDIFKKPAKEASYWTNSGEENLQFSQLAVSNWIKGGENSLTLTHDLRMKALYAKDKVQWESSLVHKLGFTHSSTVSARVSTDELNLSSKFGYKAVNKWYYSFLSTFKTQMFRNYSKSDKEKANPTSTLLSPAYIQFVIGMDYKKDNLSLLLSPFTSIMTVVADTADIDQTKYGVAADKRSKTVNGFSVTLGWKKTIMYGFTYTTNVECFYEYFEKDGNKRLDWENVFDLQFNRFLSTRFLFELRYFDNESDKFQVKENFSISFKYTF